MRYKTRACHWSVIKLKLLYLLSRCARDRVAKADGFLKQRRTRCLRTTWNGSHGACVHYSIDFSVPKRKNITGMRLTHLINRHEGRRQNDSRTLKTHESNRAILKCGFNGQ